MSPPRSSQRDPSTSRLRDAKIVVAGDRGETIANWQTMRTTTTFQARNRMSKVNLAVVSLLLFSHFPTRYLHSTLGQVNKALK